ncbi:hypothetical protein [Cohnella sp. GCM10012308]|uniref:hypothetical protein n=1 Tax=Cohnella sp. GCM10012308 TaxID=3317329 RepID=UPI003608332D
MSDAEIDDFADDYNAHSGLGGFYVRDEPDTSRWQGYAKAYNRFLFNKTNAIPYANLFPTYADPYTQLEIAPTPIASQTVVGNGTWVNSTNRLGQTFKTAADSNYIFAIELNIDASSWGSTEGLTLTLWDSPSKTVRLSSSTLFATNNGAFPRFELLTAVSPNTTYYWELTHNGGGDNSVGWVTTSTSDAYADGAAYNTGTVQANDFYFKALSGRAQIPVSPVLQSTRDDVSHYVSSTNSLGQTFRTSAEMDYIGNMELYINYNTWSTTEGLTLSLWNSPAKTTLLSSKTLYSTNNMNHVLFAMNTAVTPNTDYYWELTHNGGGDNSVGPISGASSLNGADLPNGSAYINGTMQNWDFYFKVFKKPLAKKTLLASQTLLQSVSSVSSAARLGQTFLNPANNTKIDTVQLLIDSNTWTAGNTLTLKLWDSPSRTTQFGSTVTLPFTNSFNNPAFAVNATVVPNTSYYWELTLSGSGSITVWNSAGNVYGDGSAYINGSAVAKDFVFKAFGAAAISDKVLEQKTTGSGTFVSSASPVGQTFRTPANLDRMLKYVELYIDYNTWASTEALTLSVYDNTAKNQLLGKATLNQTNNGFYPRFPVNALLKPDTTYYFELSHNGGGDNSVGWVVHSATNAYTDGTAYQSGTAQTWDLYFRNLYTEFYSDYLDEWVDLVGPLSLKYLSYDHYPFQNGGLTVDYFLNLELVRDTGLRKKVKTHMFLQSVGLGGYMNRPNENQMRWNVYTGLAYGMKGLSWFTWKTPELIEGPFTTAIIDRDGNKTDLYAPVQTLNAEITRLGPTLMGLTNRDVYHSGSTYTGVRGVPNNFFWKPGNSSDDVILSYYQNALGRKYIMAVNKSLTTTTSFTFNLNPKPASVTEVSKTTGLEVATAYNTVTGSLTASFLPGEGKLYALPAGY